MTATAEKAWATPSTVGKSKAGREYHALVARMADGQSPHADEILAMLEEVGRTPEHFEEDVNRAANRDELKKRLAELPALRRQCADTQAKLEKAGADLDKLVAAKQAEMAAIIAERNRLTEAVAHSQKAEGQLLRTCANLALLGREREIGRELLRLQPRPSELRNAINACHHSASLFREQARKTQSDGDRAAKLEMAEAEERSAQRLEEEFSAVGRRENALKAELAQIVAAKLAC